LKKFASIAFVVIILFNTVGYYGVFLGLQFKNDLTMSKALAEDIYDEANSITVKVPVSIPYMPDQSDFERVEGKIEHNGRLYRMVKQRYAKDTLTIVCIKDIEHHRINVAHSDFVKTVTDKAPDSKPASKATISIIKDFLPTSIDINSITAGWAVNVSHNSRYQNIIPHFLASIVHPPERA